MTPSESSLKSPRSHVCSGGVCFSSGSNNYFSIFWQINCSGSSISLKSWSAHVLSCVSAWCGSSIASAEVSCFKKFITGFFIRSFSQIESSIHPTLLRRLLLQHILLLKALHRICVLFTFTDIQRTADGSFTIYLHWLRLYSSTAFLFFRFHNFHPVLQFLFLSTS